MRPSFPTKTIDSLPLPRSTLIVPHELSRQARSNSGGARCCVHSFEGRHAYNPSFERSRSWLATCMAEGNSPVAKKAPSTRGHPCRGQSQPGSGIRGDGPGDEMLLTSSCSRPANRSNWRNRRSSIQRFSVPSDHGESRVAGAGAGAAVNPSRAQTSKLPSAAALARNHLPPQAPERAGPGSPL